MVVRIAIGSHQDATGVLQVDLIEQHLGEWLCVHMVGGKKEECDGERERWCDRGRERWCDREMGGCDGGRKEECD